MSNQRIALKSLESIIFIRILKFFSLLQEIWIIRMITETMNKLATPLTELIYVQMMIF